MQGSGGMPPGNFWLFRGFWCNLIGGKLVSSFVIFLSQRDMASKLNTLVSVQTCLHTFSSGFSISLAHRPGIISLLAILLSSLCRNSSASVSTLGVNSAPRPAGSFSSSAAELSKEVSESSPTQQELAQEISQTIPFLPYFGLSFFGKTI